MRFPIIFSEVVEKTEVREMGLYEFSLVLSLFVLGIGAMKECFHWLGIRDVEKMSSKMEVILERSAQFNFLNQLAGIPSAPGVEFLDCRIALSTSWRVIGLLREGVFPQKSPVELVRENYRYQSKNQQRGCSAGEGPRHNSCDVE
ncbi:hypothetical protein AVEN_212036-1 [Araneus ventricosus]|uniref:Uncharacterized protein n=1 Tax=Araneus ventricosus TaxID=182803 RepID=A0A4Y2H4B5_ARAVE|nr:hypothetical protein AVEN_212036-1 [Araneus ventricosus]